MILLIFGITVLAAAIAALVAYRLGQRSLIDLLIDSENEVDRDTAKVLRRKLAFRKRKKHKTEEVADINAIDIPSRPRNRVRG